MSRNRKLELESMGSGRWKTSDGRFVVLRQRIPINPMEASDTWKIRQEYSIRDMSEMAGMEEHPQLAPEVGKVATQGEIFPWLGKFTGEGSFELGNPERATAKRSGGMHEDVLAERVKPLDTKWLTGIRKWWKQWVKKADKISRLQGEKGAAAATEYLREGVERIEAIRRDITIRKGYWPYGMTQSKKDDATGNPMMAGQRDLDSAQKALGAHANYIEFTRKSIHSAGSREYASGQYIRVKGWGPDGDLDGLDSAILDTAKTVKDADKIVSGKFIRRFMRHINLWTKMKQDPAQVDDVDLEYSIGKMKVIVKPTLTGELGAYELGSSSDRHVSPYGMKRFEKGILKARALLNKAGFKRAWYGQIHVKPSAAHASAAGIWKWDDVIEVYPASSGDIAGTIIHEIGHRWWFKNMSAEERERFSSYFGKVKSTSSYGATRPREDFAEVFKAYVLGNKLTRDQRERFKEFATKRLKARRHEDVFEMHRMLTG